MTSGAAISLGAAMTVVLVEGTSDQLAVEALAERRGRHLPAQRDKSEPAQLRRFMGTRGGRKIEYAPVLLQALDLAQVPTPLDRLLTSLGR